MAITYDAGTNLITYTGDGINPAGGTSWATAYDMEDVLAACGVVVTKQGANAYDVSARLKFESGVYFVSKNEFVELKPNPINPAYTIQIDSSAHVQFGDYNSIDKYSYNGAFWRIYTSSTTGGNSGNVIYGEWLCYGSNVWNDAATFTRGIHFKAGATIRMYNSIIRAKSYFWAVDHDLQDTKWFGTGIGTYDMLIASGFNFNWAGLTTMDCNYGLFFSGTTTSDVDLYAPLILDSGSREIFLSSGCNWLIRIINPVVKPTNIAGTGSGRPGCQICYTFNVKVTDGTNPVVGATAELKDKNGDIVFTEQTVVGGVLVADKIVKVDWYKHADNGGHLTYGDHTLKVTNGTDVTEYEITIDHQISEDVVLIPQSVASYDNIMEGINDIKGVGFVKDTHSLKPILDDVTGLNGEAMRGSDGVPTTPLLATDARIDTIAGDVAGLDGNPMRGTDGANTTIPPTTGEIKIELEGAGTKLSLVKIATDKLHFTGNDVKATLDGEEVTTDAASREASKATGFSEPDEYDPILTEIKQFNYNKLEIHKASSELWLYDDAGINVIKKWPLTDKDGKKAALTDRGPANRGQRSL